MNGENFYLVLSGELLDGYRDEEVVSALCRLLHMPEPLVKDMLQGRPARIRKAVTKEKAVRMMSKIIACGAGCTLEPVNGSIDAEAEPPAEWESSERSGEAVSRTPTEVATRDRMESALQADSGLSLELLDIETDPEEAATGVDPDDGSGLEAGSPSQPFDSGRPPEPTPAATKDYAAPAAERPVPVESAPLAREAPPPSPVQGLSLEPLALASQSEPSPGELRLEPIELPAEPEQGPAEVSPVPESSDGIERVLLATRQGGIEGSVAPPDESSAPAAGPETSNRGQVYEQPFRSRPEAADRPPVKETPRGRWMWAALGLVLMLTAVWGGMQFVGGDTSVAGQGQSEALSTVTAPPPDPQQASTRARLDQLSRGVKIWMIQYGAGFDPAQVTMGRVQQDLQISEGEMLDAWDTPFRYQAQGERFVLISAGVDRMFDTGDDLVLERSAR